MKLTPLLLFSLVFLIPSSMGDSFGDHGSGGGSGCSGDCTPPTMGIYRDGLQNLPNGFTINGKSFDVDYYTQNIQTQIFNVGEPIEITLRISENSGAFYLSHVQLMLGETDELVSGQLIPSHPVTIVWDKSLDDTESFFVIDENDFLSEVNVQSFVEGDPAYDLITVLTFSFVPLSEFNTNPIVVTMWDHNLSSWTNYFYDAMIIDPNKSNLDQSSVLISENKSLVLPAWIKNNAGFWADDLIDDLTFVGGIKYCIDNGIIEIPDLPKFSPDDKFHFVDVTKGSQHYIDRYYNEPSYQEWFDTNFPDNTIEEAVGLNAVSSTDIPDWIKNNAGWWSDGQIDDASFVSGIEYLVENGIIVV